MYPLCTESKKSMESNIPVVGGDEPKQDVSSTTAPPAEATNGASPANTQAMPNNSQAEQLTSDTGRAPEQPAATEHDPAVEHRGETVVMEPSNVEEGVLAQGVPEAPQESSSNEMQTLLEQH